MFLPHVMLFTCVSCLIFFIEMTQMLPNTRVACDDQTRPYSYWPLYFPPETRAFQLSSQNNVYVLHTLHYLFKQCSSESLLPADHTQQGYEQCSSVCSLHGQGQATQAPCLNYSTREHTQWWYNLYVHIDSSRTQMDTL